MPMMINYLMIGMAVAVIWDRITECRNEPSSLITAAIFWPTVVCIGVLYTIITACKIVSLDYIIRERKDY